MSNLKINKKLVALILSGVITTSLCCGCSDDKYDEEKESIQTEEEIDDENEIEDSVVQIYSNNVDLEGSYVCIDNDINNTENLTFFNNGGDLYIIPSNNFILSIGTQVGSYSYKFNSNKPVKAFIDLGVNDDYSYFCNIKEVKDLSKNDLYNLLDDNYSIGDIDNNLDLSISTNTSYKNNDIFNKNESIMINGCSIYKKDLTNNSVESYIKEEDYNNIIHKSNDGVQIISYKEFDDISFYDELKNNLNNVCNEANNTSDVDYCSLGAIDPSSIIEYGNVREEIVTYLDGDNSFTTYSFILKDQNLITFGEANYDHYYIFFDDNNYLNDFDNKKAYIMNKE